jgi:predicted O-methyltransferase YrrM
MRVARRLDGIDDVQTIAKEADFHDYVSRIRDSGTDSLAHFGNGYSHEGGLALQQHPDELAALLVFLKQRQPFANYLEIGAGSGGTCRLLCEAIRVGSVWVIDDGQHPRAGEQDANLAAIKDVRRFVGDSHSKEASRFLETHLTNGVDLAWIDGDHSYAGALQDFQLVREFAAAGCLVVFHDTVACPEVRRVWLQAVLSQALEPLAEFVGAERPLGIAVGRLISDGPVAGGG